MKFNIHKQINNIVFFIFGIILTFISGCKDEINNPVPLKEKDYLEYGSAIKKGLIAYYPFDGNAKDYSGNEYNGLKNELSYTEGRFKQLKGAVHFNGVNDFIEIPSFFNSDSGTICFWVRTKGRTNDDYEASVFSKIDTTGYGYVLSIYDSGNFWFNYKIPYVHGGESTYIRSHDTINYIFIAVTFTTGRLTYFSQGYPTLGSTLTPANYIFNSNNQPIFLGKSLISKYNLFEGDIDDLLIYNRELTHDEIMELNNWK
jgi:trimeric autotransporter adhesin